jgi:RHS repeat-associated protein
MGNYTYDSRNRLTNAGGFAYRYNAEGDRVGLTSANETTTLTVDPQGALSKVLERVKNGARTRYVYGAGLQYEVNDAGAPTYYHYDQSGNTAALTNQAGAIIERVVYSPYGTIRYRQSNFDTPFLYGGFFGVMTDANGLINMRARYYNPLTMRFLNSDPAMDGLNWYAYANGNPINFADPTGYGAQKVLGAMNSGLNALGMVGGLMNSFISGATGGVSSGLRSGKNSAAQIANNALGGGLTSTVGSFLGPDAGGRLMQANDHYRNGNKQSVAVQTANYNLGGVDPNKFNSRGLQPYTFPMTSVGDFVVNGSVTLQLSESGTSFGIRSDLYNFEMHENRPVRNFETVIAGFIADPLRVADGAYEFNFQGTVPLKTNQ